MSKRSNTEKPVELGASEFAAILNGEDPTAVLKALQRFTKIVRRERRIALGGAGKAQESDSSNDDESDDDDDQGPTQKRFRKDESWKEDSANYSVPFVGTSFSRQQEKIVPGEWPTGLMKAYLEKSPLALELTGENLIPQHSTLHKTLLKRKMGRTSHKLYKVYLEALAELATVGEPYTKELIRRRLPDLFSLLKEETANGKGKAGIVGGCGALAVPVLAILSRLPGRCVVKENLTFWRFLLKPSKHHEEEQPRDGARIACLDLATALLLQDGDALVFSTICTSGVRDRKISPGILYLALKEGISGLGDLEGERGDKLAKAATTLLSALYDVLERNDSASKSLIDLFSREAVLNLCELASANGSPLAEVAKRSLFLLVAQSEKSPLLNAANSVHSRHIVVQALYTLLNKHSGVEIQRLVSKSLSNSPTLFPLFFRGLSIPDWKRSLFLFLSRLHLVCSLMQHGPSASQCLGKERNEQNVLSAIVPWELKNTVLRKNLQSSHPLVVSETLRVLLIAMERFDNLQSDNNIPHLDEWMVKHILPDISTILSTLSKSDAVIYRACLLLRRIHLSLPTMWKDVNFDWAKILSLGFEKKPLYLQRMTLTTFSKVVDEVFLSPAAQVNLFRVIMGTVLRTESVAVWRASRNLAIRLLSKIQGGGHAYELSCWVDGTTQQTLKEFCTVLQNSSMIGSLLLFADTWRESEPDKAVPAVPVSPVFAQSFQFLPRASKEFTELACKIAMKCLLYQSRPISLAVFLHSSCRAMLDSGSTNEPSAVKQVMKYTAILLRYGCNSTSDWAGSLLQSSSILSACSSEKKDGFRSSVAWMPNVLQNETCVADAIVGIQQLTHLIAVSGEVKIPGDSIRILNRLIPVAFPCDGNRFEAMVLRLEECLAQTGSDEIRSTSLLLFSGLDTSATSYFCGNFGYGDVETLCDCLASGERHVESQNILSLFVKAPFLAPELLFRGLQALVKVIPVVPTSVLLNTITLKFLEVAVACVGLIDDSYDSQQSVNLVKAIVWAWFISSESVANDGTEKIVDQAENCISTLLRNGGAASTLVIMALSEYTTDRIVSKCMDGARAKAISDGAKSLLCLLIEEDMCRFGKEFDSQLVSVPQSPQYFNSGFLDVPISLILKNQLGVKRDEESIENWKLNLMARACKQISLETSIDNSDVLSTLLGLLKLGQVDDSLLCKLVVPLTRHVNLKFHGQSSFPPDTALVLEFSTRLSGLFAQSEITGSSLLSTELLLSLSEMIPLSLKFFLRKKGNRSANNLPEPCDLLRWAMELLRQNQRFDRDRFADAGGIAFTSLIRSLLRHGLNPEDPGLETMNFCLRIVQLLVEAVSNHPKDWVQLYPSCSKSLAGPVFDMVVSHSKFEQIVCSDSNTSQKIVVSRLLLSCLSRMEKVEFDPFFWDTLLRSFQAGVDDGDLVIRMLLKQYGECVVSTSKQILSMDRLRWGDTPKSLSSQDHWEWLADALELSRVDSTLREFPVSDSVDPSIPQDKLSNRLEGTGSQPNYQHASDRRYSPGFLLPVVLAYLEYATAHRVSSHGDSEGPHDSVKSFHVSGHTVGLVQRLCDKGAIAIAMAALCSKCANIRRVSVSILGIVTITLNSEAAKAASSWRDRPQLSMILDSVQRALVCHLTDKSLDKFSVPRLPGVSAIFLAKAFQILQRPGDRLYATMNRVFLRIQKDCGAFQDLWRVPAFISLLCSSSDEPEQVASERAWALHLLRDGFVDDSCYKPVLSCHAPELLVTTLDNLRLNPSSDRHGEYSLVLQTLETILRRGGDRCEIHFIQRLGLLSSLRSFVVARPILEALRSPNARVAFLRLARVILNKASALLSRAEFSAATSCLGQHFIIFCLESVEDARDNDDVSSIVANTARALFALANLETRADNDIDFVRDVLPLRSVGISLQSAIDFVLVLEDQDLPSFLIAVCCLPLTCPVTDTATVEAFCIKMLESLQEIEQKTPSLLAVVMCKISKILRGSKKSFEDNNSTDAVLKLLLSIRKTSAETEASWSAWASCISELTARHIDTSCRPEKALLSSALELTKAHGENIKKV